MRLQGRRVAVLVADGFEDLEFWVVVMRLREEGAEVTILGEQASRRFRGKNGLQAQADASYEEVSPEQWDAIVVPGGWAPDKLRRSDAVKELVRGVDARRQVVGLICHAGLVAISAGIVRGRRVVGSLGIKDDLVNAGGRWVDEPAFQEGNLVWGRVVDDIPAFCRELVRAISAQPEAERP